MKKLIVVAAGVGVIGAGAMFGVGAANAAQPNTAAAQPCSLYIGNGNYAPCPPPAVDDGSDGSTPLTSAGSSLPDGATATAILNHQSD